MPANINREIDMVRSIPRVGPLLANGLSRLQDAINSLGTNLSGDAAGVLPPPPQIQELMVKTDGFGAVHMAINDSNPIQKNLHYFVEYDNNAAFPKPQVIHLGVSRSLPPFFLPETDDDGNPQLWHFRAYSQYPGGDPSAPVNFGGNSPTPVNTPSGIQMTLIPSTGSGTAQVSGEQGGSGFGKTLYRRAVGPKRLSA